MKSGATPLAGAVLVLVLGVAFWPVVGGARSFFHWDLRYEIVPLWHVSQEALRSGHWPFWIDGEYCGHPALLRQEVAVFHPLTLALLATNGPPHRLADLFSLFHFWLAGFAAYLLVRGLDGDFVSGLFGAVAWMLSARMVQSAIWPNAVAVSALLPLIVLGLVRIARGRRRSGVLVSGLSGGLALLAFRPQVLVGAAPVLVALVVAVVVIARQRRRALSDLVVAGVLAFAIGAPALLTSAAIYPLSTRVGGLPRVDRDIEPIGRQLDQVFLPVDGPTRWPEAAAYPGVAVGLLFLAGAAFVLLRGSSFPRGIFAALAAGGLLGLVFAFGESGPYGLVADLPLMRSFRIPARFLVSWSLALALCSALVLSHLLRKIRHGPVVGFSMLALLCVDLVLHAWRAGQTAPAALYRTEPAIVRILEKRLSIDESGFPHRFWAHARPVQMLRTADEDKVWATRWLEPLAFGLGMQFGLEAVQGLEGPTLRASQILSETPSLKVAALTGAASVVRWIRNDSGTGPPLRIALQDVSALPRALVVPEAVAAPPGGAMAAVLAPSFDPRRTAVVEGTGPLARRAGWDRGGASVRMRRRRAGSVELAARLPAEGILVLAQSYERGWRATVDGRPVPVFRADAAFLGVRLPAGEHDVRFEYRPRGLREGLALAAAGALGLVLMAIRLPASTEEPV